MILGQEDGTNMVEDILKEDDMDSKVIMSMEYCILDINAAIDV